MMCIWSPCRCPLESPHLPAQEVLVVSELMTPCKLQPCWEPLKTKDLLCAWMYSQQLSGP
jgi:hypothetical protein